MRKLKLWVKRHVDKKFVIIVLLVCLIILSSGCITDSESTVGTVVEIPDSVTTSNFMLKSEVIDIGGRGVDTSVYRTSDIVKYRLTITNTGETNLTNMTIYEVWQGLELPTNLSNDVLGVGETWTFDGSYQVSENNMQWDTATNTFKVIVNGYISERSELVVKVDDMKRDFYTDCNTYVVGGDGHTIQFFDNPDAVNPTYKQMMDFLRKDRTDRHAYIDNEYVCADFAEDVQHNAELAGWNCGFVMVDFVNDDAGHMCNVFNTTDRGLVFIDCTNSGTGPNSRDCRVNIEQGSEYIPNFLFDGDAWHCRSMGTVRSYDVFW